MIKLITLVCKKPGISDEEFYKHLKEIHGPLFVRLVPGLRKYTQNHVVKAPGFNHDFDHVGEAWFDDMDAFKEYLAWRKTSEAKVLLDDEAKFVDTSKIVRHAVVEYIVL